MSHYTCNKCIRKPHNIIGQIHDKSNNTNCSICSINISDSKHYSYYRDENNAIICLKCSIGLRRYMKTFDQYCVEHRTLLRPSPTHRGASSCPKCFEIDNSSRWDKYCMICYSYLLNKHGFLCRICTSKCALISYKCSTILPKELLLILLDLWCKTRFIVWW